MVLSPGSAAETRTTSEPRTVSWDVWRNKVDDDEQATTLAGPSPGVGDVLHVGDVQASCKARIGKTLLSLTALEIPCLMDHPMRPPTLFGFRGSRMPAQVPSPLFSGSRYYDSNSVIASRTLTWVADRTLCVPKCVGGSLRPCNIGRPNDRKNVHPDSHETGSRGQQRDFTQHIEEVIVIQHIEPTLLGRGDEDLDHQNRRAREETCVTKDGRQQTT